MDNPPAFPNSGAYGHTGDYLPEGGMTLRDWFAGQALVQTDMVSHQHGMSAIQVGAPLHPTMAAKAAYRFADAMLAARKEQGK